MFEHSLLTPSEIDEPADPRQAPERLGNGGEPAALIERSTVSGAGLLAGPWRSQQQAGEASAPAMTAWNLQSMLVARQSCDAHAATRDRRDALADQLDHYQVVAPVAGQGLTVLSQQTTVHARAGEPVLLDLARDAKVVLSAGSYVSAFVPRESLDELLAAPQDLHCIVARGASGLVLSEHLRSLTACLSQLAACQGPHAAAATRHIIAAAVSSAPATDCGPRRDTSSVLRQACRYIDLHLDDPELSANAIARAFGLSRATLYRMFEPYGGVQTHIRERRLERVREVLCAGGDSRRHIARVAEAHGFLDPAQFSRAYRRHFGHRPSDAAAYSWVPAAKPSGDEAASSIVDWLRALRA